MFRDVIRLLVIISGVSASTFDQQPLTSGSSGTKDPFTEVFTQMVEKGLKEWHAAGIAISVVDGNDTFAKVSGIIPCNGLPVLTPPTLAGIRVRDPSQRACNARNALVRGLNNQSTHDRYLGEID
jgi:hypothetical protein